MCKPVIKQNAETINKKRKKISNEHMAYHTKGNANINCVSEEKWVLTNLVPSYISRAQRHKILTLIFGKNEILVSKWSWQHQLFQGNKILTPTRTVFTQYTNVRSLPGNLPCCTTLIVLGNNILTPGLTRMWS